MRLVGHAEQVGRLHDVFPSGTDKADALSFEIPHERDGTFEVPLRTYFLPLHSRHMQPAHPVEQLVRRSLP